MKPRVQFVSKVPSRIRITEITGTIRRAAVVLVEMARKAVVPMICLATALSLQSCDPANDNVYLTNKTDRDILYAPLMNTWVGSFVSVPSHQRVKVEKEVFETPEDAIIKDASTRKVISKVHYARRGCTSCDIDITYPPEPPARYFKGYK